MPTKKKSPPFCTDQVSLSPFKVQAKDLVKTSLLGVTASVIGLKRGGSEGDEATGTLWVDYRCGYRSPLEKDGFEPCSAAAHLWKGVHDYHSMVEADAEMREKILELNERFKLGLLEKENKKKKK